MPLRALLIDDEALARSRLRLLLDTHADELEIVGEAANGDEALDCIRRLQPDVLFLDIQMPEMDGFQVLQRLPDPAQRPLVVFVTAFDEHALRAFDAHALDYLLKPVEPERLAHAVAKIVRSADQPDDHRTAVAQLLAQLAPSSRLHRISVTVGDRIRLLNVEHITHFTADRKYTSVHTRDQTYLISTTLSDLEDRLDPETFLRIHRSTIVNLEEVREIRRFGRGRLRVILNDGTRLDVGRSYTGAVRAL